MATISHVPAWKKLGLKLKFAKDVPSSDSNGIEAVSRGTKRAHEQDDVLPPTRKSSKKVKRSKAIPVESSTVHLADSSVTLSEILNPPVSKPTPRPTKQKSVSFTPETKTEDGDSIKQFYNTWLAQQTPDFDPQKSAPALQSINPKPVGDKNELPKVKKLKKQKISDSSSTVLETTSNGEPLTESRNITTDLANVPSFLQYLIHYHTSPSTWKFNKSKQISLLKHVFDPVLTPPAFDTPLTAYLSGLASTATRSRLCESAIDILDTASSDPTSTQDPKETQDPKHTMDAAALARKKLHYRQALQKHKIDIKSEELVNSENEKERNPAWRQQHLKRKRALLVLSAMCPESEDDDNDGSTVDRAKGKNQGEGIGTAYTNADEKVRARASIAPSIKKRRKRKRRTGVPEDDSTSEDMSSDSSDEDGNAKDSEKGSNKPIAPTLASNAKAENDENGKASESDSSTSSSTESSTSSSSSNSSSSSDESSR